MHCVFTLTALLALASFLCVTEALPEIEIVEPPSPSVNCSAQDGSLLVGCSQYIYPEVTGFPATTPGRRNPERGFYKYTETRASSFTPVSDEPLDDWINEGITLIFRMYVLDEFVEEDISTAFLNNIEGDFVTIKVKSLKLILRFSYTTDIGNPNDALPGQVKKHIEQLTPILQNHVGVIALMQAGFVGVKGEGYYTANYGNEGDISPVDLDKRRQVVFDLLDALPVSRQIALENPSIKQMILDRISPLTYDEAHEDTTVARIGHYTFCFLGSETDYGIYMDEDYPYLQNETLYVSQGGETCVSNPPTFGCPTARDELSELHYTYFNSRHHPEMLGTADEECFKEIDNSLGYRLVAKFSRMAKKVTKGSNISVGVRIQNIGFSAPINYRSAKLVMIPLGTGEEYESPLNVELDLRKVMPGEEFDLDLILSVPESATTGDYEVLLKFPDGDASLEDIPAYNIVMENTKYDADLDKRLNLLGLITVIN